jgi:SAM-dependent methyltransferase
MPSGRRLGHDPDSDWERYGREEPYYGVYFDPRFRRKNLTPERVREFFESGEQHVRELWTAVSRHLVPEFTPRRVLDFGCGVGRLLVPFARRAREVVGVDVSPSMLEEARRNLHERGLSNAELVGSLAEAGGAFDLVHSYIVLQHVPRARGERLIEELVDSLAEGGVGAIHVTFENELGRRTRVFRWARRSLPLVHAFWNWKDGKPLDSPWMQMNRYDMNRLLQILQDRSCHRCFVRFTNHFGHRGVVLFFEKRAAPSFP